MPDEILPESLIASARKLLSENPTQADLRVVISTAYFAVYHALARQSAHSLVGDDRVARPNRAWVEVYRGLSHGSCKDACDKAKSIGFPDEIEGFANTFVQLQVARKRVDYDPTCELTSNGAEQWLAIAEVSIEMLLAADANSQKAFATWVLITSPGASLARTALKNNIGPQLNGPMQ
jgi:uncharacterized protein (UPF0332 family)